MKQNIVKTKSFDFAVRVVNLSNFLKKEYREYSLSGQIIRSGTAVGALIREAEHSESPKDFIHKLSISLKEINETLYWLDLLRETKFIEEKIYCSLKSDAEEIIKILTASVKTSKQRIK